MTHPETLIGSHSRSSGFTLIEIALVLVVIGVLWVIWSYTVPWSSQEQVYQKTRQTFQETSQALILFARSNHRLPCPDTDKDGDEDCGGGAIGQVPYTTLLLPDPVWDGHHAELSYAIYRNAAGLADLGQEPLNLIDTMNDVNDIDVVSSHETICDFCEALRNGLAAGASANFASVSNTTAASGCAADNVINQAFVLASSGLESADGAGSRFDGENEDADTVCYASPRLGRTVAYDDLVSGGSFTGLIGALCRTPNCLGPHVADP